MHCRLDKPVSGILILAKGGSAARRTMALMELADVNKLYVQLQTRASHQHVRAPAAALRASAWGLGSYLARVVRARGTLVDAEAARSGTVPHHDGAYSQLRALAVD